MQPRDFRDYPNATQIDTDLCIIGAGAAGITLARSFIGKNIAVCLLESGGPDFDVATQALYQGDNIGMQYYPLEKARLRFFGGTTAIWGGRCTPLDRIDFERRDWIPYSGWPFSLDTLQAYYRRAERLLELDPDIPYDERVWPLLDTVPPALNPAIAGTVFWRFDPVFWRFGIRQCRDILQAPNITLLLHANAVHLQAAGDAGRLSHLDIAALDGPRGRIRAKVFVLASGGIENPRLLMASNHLGNQNDQVGRFFMEHPHGRAGRVIAPDPYPLWRIYRKRHTARGIFAPSLRVSDELQAKAAILNTSVTLKFQRSPGRGVPLNKALYSSIKTRVKPTTGGRRLWRFYRQLNEIQHRLPAGIMRRVLQHIDGGMYLLIRGEQSPNPASRVVLSQRRDALGVPLADLDWRLSELDKRSVACFTEALDGEFQRLGLGRIEAEPWLQENTPEWPLDPTVGNHPIGGYHHIGTTRMSSDARRGVVDADCRMHEIENVYVAGSSVFPTAGWANPTLTIIALSLRLADHLEQRLS